MLPMISPERWLEHIDAWQQTNLTQADYCRTHGLRAKQFWYWKSKLQPENIVYCSNAALRISYIMAENAIRPFVVGRKAWLFADSTQGAKASAICYSLVESAKLNGLEPYEYLHTVLTKLPYAETVEQVESLLPWNISKG